jgi:nucleotide-binding universal stress UspA family protein
MAEINRILCPIDFSDTSRHALDHAFAFAQWYEARVAVFHVLNVPLSVMPPTSVPADLSGLPPPRLDDVAEEVRRFSGLTNAGNSSRADVVVVEGSPVREILRQAEQMRADLLVMGTHGRSGFEALFLGSVTEKVLRSTQVPVLTVPPAVERVKAVIYKTILCPIEFSDVSTRALEYALTLAEERHSRCRRTGESGSDRHGRAWQGCAQPAPVRIDRTPRDSRGALSRAHVAPVIVMEHTDAWPIPRDRPATIGQIVSAMGALLSRTSPEQSLQAGPTPTRGRFIRGCACDVG